AGPSAAATSPAVAPAAPPSRSGPVPATPATRRLARELGVDLRAVPPSGPGGRVTDDDVRAAAARASTPAQAAAPPRPAAAGGTPLPPPARPPAPPRFAPWR